VNSLHVLYQMARADFLERVRRYSFLVTLAFAVYLGYSAYSGRVVMRLGDYRGVYNTAWLSALMTLVTTTFLSLVGFYVVRNSVDRDQQTGVGRILAATPMTRFFYTAAKVVSNFAVLSAMVLVLMAAAVAMQLTKGEGPVHLGTLITPFLVVALPTVAVVAALAILFETTPVLRGGAGNVIYFFAWTAILAAPIQTGLPDMAGIGIFMNSMEQTVKAIDPAWKRTFTLGLGGDDLESAPVKIVQWPGLHWDAKLLLGRILWLGVAVGLTALAAMFFHRFDPAYERRRKRSGEREITPAAEATQLSPAAVPVHLTPLPVQACRPRIAYLVKSELLLMLKGRRWWWHAVMASLIVASAAVPDANARAGIVAATLLWPVLVWSQLGTRENRFGTGALMFSSPEPLRTQLTATWIAGILFTTVVAAGPGLRALMAGDWGAITAWAAGVLFIPTLALALGAWSGTSKTFEAIYTVWWYAGVANHLRGLDFIGTLEQSRAPMVFLMLTLALAAAAYAGRRVRLAYA
jgi:hypothetical protein